MKKAIILFILLITITTNVNAQSKNTNGIDINVPKEALNRDDANTSLTNQERLLGYVSKYVATTYEYNLFGQIENVYEKEITEEESNLIVNNPNLHLLGDGVLHDLSKENNAKSNYRNYETNSKKLELW